MNPAYVLILVIVGVVILSWIIQGIRLYRNCKGDIYNNLYGSFLAYFYHYVVIRDCSESGSLRSEIGPHKIVFSTINREENQRTKFCVIFYHKGIMILCYDRGTGEYHGNAANKDWSVLRKDKEGVQHAYRHHNPTMDMKAYIKRIAEIFPETHIEARIAFGQEADYTKLHSDIKTIHFADIPEELKNVQAEYISDENLKAMYEKIMKG